MCTRIIEFGILFLLVYTPFAYGGVSPYSQALLQFITGGLCLVWLLKQTTRRQYISQQSLQQRRFRVAPSLPTAAGTQKKNRFYFRLTWPPGWLALCLFFVLQGLQLVPLPSQLIVFLSPSSYALYAEGASHTLSSIPRWLPISVCVQATRDELLLFLVYPTVFLLLINSIRSPKQIRRFLYTILGVGALEALCGFLQMFWGIQWFASYDASSWAHGSFVNKNHFAGFLSMIALLGLGMLLARVDSIPSGRSPSSKKPRNPLSEQYAKTFLLLMVLFAILAAHIGSGSRGGLLGLGGGLLCFLLLSGSRSLLRRWLLLLLTCLPLLLLLIVLVIPTQLESFGTRFAEGDFDFSSRLRWEIWKTEWHIFQDFPLFGSGFGTFSNLAQRYQTFRWYLRLVHSESDILQLLVETGLVGLILILCFLGSFFAEILSRWRRRRSRWALALVAGGLSSIGSVLLHGFVDFNLHIPANALLLSVIAALTYVTVHTRESSRHHEKA